MPKKPTTTREAMLEGALQLMKEKGHEFLTARNLAAFLGCSTQPIMYQFPNLDTLRDLTYQKADAFHSEYILAGGDLLEIGMRYIRFSFPSTGEGRVLPSILSGKPAASLIILTTRSISKAAFSRVPPSSSIMRNTIASLLSSI